MGEEGDREKVYREPGKGRTCGPHARSLTGSEKEPQTVTYWTIIQHDPPCFCLPYAYIQSSFFCKFNEKIKFITCMNFTSIHYFNIQILYHDFNSLF